MTLSVSACKGERKRREVSISHIVLTSKKVSKGKRYIHVHGGMGEGKKGGEMQEEGRSVKAPGGRVDIGPQSQEQSHSVVVLVGGCQM